VSHFSTDTKEILLDAPKNKISCQLDRDDVVNGLGGGEDHKLV